jgi:hypothetical protein
LQEVLKGIPYDRKKADLPPLSSPSQSAMQLRQSPACVIRVEREEKGGGKKACNIFILQQFYIALKRKCITHQHEKYYSPQHNGTPSAVARLADGQGVCKCSDDITMLNLPFPSCLRLFYFETIYC